MNRVVNVDHLSIRASDFRKSKTFYGKLFDFLGFTVLDEYEDAIGWTNGRTRFWIGQADGRLRKHRTGDVGFHHYAFELEGWGALGQYADHVARSGQQFIWGPGRHGPGFNHFTYLLDPDGAVVEAYSDLLKIYDEAAYVPIDWSRQRGALNLWGPLLPDGWGDHGVPVIRPG